MSEITTLLRAADAGDSDAAGQVIQLLYADLQRLARSRMRRSGDMTLLDATGLVHESFLQMRQTGLLAVENRGQFMAYAATVMRNIVIDTVRLRKAERNGGQHQHVTLNTAVANLAPQQDDEIMQVHEALAELAQLDPRLAQVVEMRYFGGLLEADIAESLGVTERTVQRDWQKARLFLSLALK